MTAAQLAAFGKKLFTAMWTSQEGAGRPMTKGTGNPISDPSSPLLFPHNFNRISGPDTNSCSGCHNKPDVGGGGDIVGNVFVLGQRFDFASFDSLDPVPTRGGVDEVGTPVFLQTIADSRKTIGMFGSGYLEMVARQMTADLQAIRDSTPPGASQALTTKGVSFGMITHNIDGTWDTSKVVGLAPPAIATSGTKTPRSHHSSLPPGQQRHLGPSIYQQCIQSPPRHPIRRAFRNRCRSRWRWVCERIDACRCNRGDHLPNYPARARPGDSKRPSSSECDQQWGEEIRGDWLHQLPRSHLASG